MQQYSEHCSKRFLTLSLFGLFVSALALVPFAALAQTTTLYTGSDTVFPVAEAALSAFVRGHAGYKPQIKDPGTSPGLKALCSGQTVMSGASRLIKAEESKACAKAGIQITEIPVALDAVVMVVSTKNTWLKDLTLAEISKAFDPASAGKVTSWKQIRASFPDTPLKTAGVGIKHATFGFFSESLGLNGFIRSDYKDFKDHADTAKYAAGDAAVLGFVPIGEAKAMEGQVRPVSIDFGAGPVAAGVDEVAAGKYDKLSRTVYLYVNAAALAKSSPEDIAFTSMMVKDMDKFVRFVNLVPLRGLQYQENTKRLASAGK
ncbi:MAG: hypothetical protein B7X59_08595 [Polaromonas sp. 39-63-203]|jgi:phosphate transport system substrate-binding protein|uniref:substrate-binding domain-containing protein n=1 Tax=Polaromonas sp. TaxID=1869339 RepID=UPI000BD0A19D|nr:substrate-binding domain-containing protein [Polaromonas sp.]OZA97077.1 MAG: hypothetical protein B7X59_08595 [Polaromonas sp. 39-63-203]HQS31658.1 substrate-binding domain-containing protein [Polaromonas sp.]HQS92853.1 substrate-binding domain-containing protein [Polaromonas sp.]